MSRQRTERPTCTELQRAPRSDIPDTQQLELLVPDMLGILRGKRVVARRVRQAVQEAASTSAALPCCSTRRVRPSSGIGQRRARRRSRRHLHGRARHRWRRCPGPQVPTAQAARDRTTAGRRAALSRIRARSCVRAVPAAQGPGTDRGRRHRARVLPARGRKQRAAHAAGSPTFRARDAAGRTAVRRAWRTSRTSTSFIAELYRRVRGAEHPGRARRSRSFSPGQFEVNLHHVPSAELACDHAVSAQARREGRRAASRHATRASWPSRSRTAARLQPACTSASSTQDGRNVFAAASGDGRSQKRFVTRSAGSRPLMAESMAIFAPTANSYRRYPSRDIFVPLTPNWGYQPPWRCAAHSDLRLPEDTRSRAPARRRRWQPVSRRGRHHGRHPSRIANRCDPGPMVSPGAGDREVTVTLPPPLGSSARRSMREACCRLSRTSATTGCTPLPARGMRPDPRADQAIATTSGICGRRSNAGPGGLSRARFCLFGVPADAARSVARFARRCLWQCNDELDPRADTCTGAIDAASRAPRSSRTSPVLRHAALRDDDGTPSTI